MALKRVAIPSPNYSTRGGAKVRLIVLHTAEGATTYSSLGAYFASSSSGVSSHVGIDDTPGTVGEYVRPDYKAWTQANANPVAVAAELCAFAAWAPAEWDRHPTMLQTAAAWIAEESRRFSIPLVRLTPGEAQGSGRGVCRHQDLGGWGGNHSDPGDNFPLDHVIDMAAGSTPAPPQPEEVDPDMIILRAPSGACATFDGVRKRGIPGPSDLNALTAAGLEVVNVSQDYFSAIPNG